MRVRRLPELQPVVLFVVALLSARGVAAQDCSDLGNPPMPRPEGATCRMFGEAKLETFQSPERTSAGVRAHLQGKHGDVVSRPNALRVENDVLTLQIGFFASGNFIPESASIDITSYSQIVSKYEHDSTLTIRVDGVQLVSDTMEVRSSFGGAAERLSMSIKYADFLKLISAKKVTLQLGQTEIELKRDVIQALNAMIDVTKSLEITPVWRCVGVTSRVGRWPG